ncbi:sugar phosphate isomerase/epimerase [Pedobacter jamesrossensis]|uniref:Sugar phosphate isomerase/epimerase n=1 Tax=Pedobacter jamesrossensis TaxID=1908238 RepID=A0ABV8NJW2_9SPHI
MDTDLKFLAPRWGFENVPWTSFLKQVKEASYSGIEWFPFAESGDYKQVLALLNHYELDYAIVMAVVRPYENFELYLTHLKEDLNKLIDIGRGIKTPLFISAQTGREFFNDDQVQHCLEACQQIQDEFHIPIYQETHRNKWSYAAHRVGEILMKNKTVRLTLDVSHWFCVSESYLEDQQSAVSEAIKHACHIHARVGHTQGPQVWEPAAEEYKEALNAHLQIWDKWVAYRRERNEPISITTEFGPAPYLIKGDRTISLAHEQWRLNIWMKDFLKNRYS